MTTQPVRSISLIAVLLAGCSGQPAPPNPGPANSNPVIDAWQKAGAEMHWMRIISENGNLEFRSPTDNRAATQPGEFLEFRFATWNPGIVSQLPQPTHAFGISWNGIKQLTDAGFKELAGLKNLQALDIGYSNITDAGLKEVAGIGSLQTLNLWGDKEITETGLKELARLPSLQNLYLASSDLTDGPTVRTPASSTTSGQAIHGTAVP